MSAFEPYKRKTVIESSSSSSEKPFKNDFFKFPFGLTSVLFGFGHSSSSTSTSPSSPPPYRKNDFFKIGSDYTRVIDVDKTRESSTIEKKEKFFIKNILKTTTETSSKFERFDKRKFLRKAEDKAEDENDEAYKMETLFSNLGKSDNGHKCIYCGKIYSRKYGLKIHIR